MKNEFQSIIVIHDEFSRDWKIYIRRYIGPIIQYLQNKDKNIGEWITVEEGSSKDHIKPILVISPEIAKELVTEFTRQGVKPLESSFVEGRLIATEKHLEDMRNLVFKIKL